MVARRAVLVTCAGLALLGISGCGWGEDEPQARRAEGAASPNGLPPNVIPKRRVVPRHEARRIAALWSAGNTYLPTRAPRKVQFSGWKITSDAGPYLTRVAIDLGGAALRWQVGWPGAHHPNVIDCPHAGPNEQTVGGRPVYLTTNAGTETAWICVAHQRFTLPVSISQRSARTGALTPDQLRAMVASARQGPPGRAIGGRSELMPPGQVRELSRQFGAPLYLPTSLPRGFIFSQWNIVRRAPVDGRRWAQISFGRNGTEMYWDVYSGVEKFAVECIKGDPPHFETKGLAPIGTWPIAFGAGIHGASAWECIPPHAVGNIEPLQVEVWYERAGDSLRPVLRKMVASSQLIPPEQ